jgi:purine-binding chemotaxis protein CheW
VSRRSVAVTPVTAPTQFLSFVLAGEEYAVDILRVREIIAYDTLTRVPGMPDCVRGMINLRGRVVPVVDLALRFGLPASVITPRTSIVVVELPSPEGELIVGIITDAVSEVLDLGADQVQPAPTFGTAVGAEFLNGMAEKSGSTKFVMLLNVERALEPSAFAHVDAG